MQKTDIESTLNFFKLMDSILYKYKEIYPNFKPIILVVQSISNEMIRGMSFTESFNNALFEGAKKETELYSIAKFLESKELIEVKPISSSTIEYRLTVQGVLKINTGGFVGEYEREKRKFEDEQRRLLVQENFHKYTGKFSYWKLILLWLTVFLAIIGGINGIIRILQYYKIN